ncbi:MAG: hypothetical protein AABW87_03190 [Nanoarchaeota archaeon]
MNENEILRKYSSQLGASVDLDQYSPGSGKFSREYNIFRREALDKQVTVYEDWCNKLVNLVRIKASEKEREQLEESIEIAHLNITPEGAASFAAFIGISFVVAGLLVMSLFYFAAGAFQWFLPLLLVLIGLFSIKPLTHLPNYMANRWRLEASNQMVLCILYIVMYMRHTSNLEHAVKFAGEHIGPPLSLDLRKVFWNIETGKFTTIEDSLEDYLNSWKKWNLEFVEAFHLVQGSLFEQSEQRRVELLDKALDVMVEGTYDKMMHYAHNLKNPITMLHMLGIILPILGLVMFPLIGSFLSGAVKWYHLAVLYNLILPVFVVIMGKQILEKRPTGYGKSDISKQNPELKKYEEVSGINPKLMAWVIAIAFVFIGSSPIILHYVNPALDFSLVGGKFLDYKGESGPFGIGALVTSLLIPIGIAIAIGMYYRLKTKKLIEVRQELDKLEVEFSGALFLLGNKIEDGVPVEVAFGKIADNLEGTASGNFFRRASINIQKLGMGIEDAIFDSRYGAILNYPSALIESSMKVLVEGARKGSRVVSKSMITISTYVDRVRKVNERLKDLLSDVISSMRSQISFLTPVIAGIVVGVGSMVVTIINKLGEQFASLQADQQFGGLAAIANILRIQDVIPSFHFQLVVGIYVVEIVLILIFLTNNIEMGVDSLYAKYDIGKSLVKSIGLYFIISFVGIVVFNMLASAVGVTTSVS